MKFPNDRRGFKKQVFKELAIVCSIIDRELDVDAGGGGGDVNIWPTRGGRGIVTEGPPENDFFVSACCCRCFISSIICWISVWKDSFSTYLILLHKYIMHMHNAYHKCTYS